MSKQEKVSILKFIDGLEIIGVVVAGGSDQVKVRNPYVIQFHPGKENDQIAIALGKIAPFAKLDQKGDLVLPFNSYLIVFDYEPDEQISSQYLSFVTQTQTNLIVPSNSGSGILKP